MQRLLEPKQVVLSEDGVTVPEPVAQRRRNPRPSPASFDLGQNVDQEFRLTLLELGLTELDI